MLHAVPSQCNVSVCGAVNDVGCCVPTAHTSSEAIAVTAASPLSTSGSTFGLGTRLHAVPFQCSMSGVVEKPVMPMPTAQTSLAVTAATASRILMDALVFGLLTTDQRVPSQCSISVLDFVKVLSA